MSWLFDKLKRTKNKDTNKINTEEILQKIEDYKKDLARKEKLGNLKNQVDEIIESEFKTEIIDYKNFEKDFGFIKSRYELLTEIKTAVPEIFTTYKFQNQLEKTEGYIAEYDKKLISILKFLEKENAITKEILDYTNAITELDAKFKLSADWNGKKPQMIELGKNLGDKRESHIMGENILNSELEDMKKEFIKGDDELKVCLIDISEELSQYIAFYKDTAKNIEELEKLL